MVSFNERQMSVVPIKFPDIAIALLSNIAVTVIPVWTLENGFVLTFPWVLSLLAPELFQFDFGGMYTFYGSIS